MSWFKAGVRLGVHALSDLSWYESRGLINLHEELVWYESGYLAVHAWVEPTTHLHLALPRDINLAVF